MAGAELHGESDSTGEDAGSGEEEKGRGDEDEKHKEKESSPEVESGDLALQEPKGKAEEGFETVSL